MKVKAQKVCPHIPLPTKSHASDAGWDLYANEDCWISSGTRRTVDTGIKLEIPDGHVGLIWPRSGMAAKRGIDVFAGVIDSGYRGVVKVCLYNSSDEDFEINRHDRIAQIIFQKVSPFLIEEAEETGDSSRKEGGFGSTGK
jgi:dUTP pyrophosphatase|tara:strand:+ start:6187 stop:6609 length:423 start_codon:yes stop_codon:yes gene_type:complete